MRNALIALCMLAWSLSTPAFAQLGINFSSPGVSIGINLPVYPQLVAVPGYPVYYAPQVNSNYFFYEGLYWVLEGDNWYESSWYNGPWYVVDRFDVPAYILRVPVRYYRHAPAYFQGWRADAPPRWGEHWGASWEQRRSGWDRWNRSSAPAPAPLPSYQRKYSGSNYPQFSQQATIQTRSYRYEPKDEVAQQHFRQQKAQVQSAPAQPAAQKQAAPRQQAAPRPQAEQLRNEQPRQAQPTRQPQEAQPPRPQQAPAAREQQAPRPQAQEREPQAKGQEKGQDKAQDRGKGRDKDRE